MAAQYPTIVPVYSNPTASMTLGSADHVALHSNINDDVVALATKAGKGASLPNTAGVWRVTNTGTQSTGWGLIQTADIGLLQITAALMAADTITAAQIAANAVDTAEINALAVTTAKIAANAVTQTGSASGSSGQITTTSTTAVDMTDMTVTFTTTGGPLLCWFSGSTYNNTVSGSNNFSLRLDSGADSFGIAVNFPAASILTSIAMIAIFTGVSAASHTVKARWSTAASQTATMFSNQRYLIVQELKK